MKAYQRINHFPGMSEICKKDLLANNLKRMKKIMPGIFNFFPLTFCLPDELRILYDYCRGRRKPDFFIIKPVKNCQGCGIYLIKGLDKSIKTYKNVVCQKYISMPLLMQSFKMDLRLYVLITSVCPLRVYIYNDGLVRLATVPYKKPTSANMHEKRMHLTNYAINRNSVGEESTEECKKALSDLEEYLVSLGFSTDHLWPTIDRIIVKTILSALPVLQHMYHTCFPIASAVSPCFELLGFDILLDDKIKPYLLEVNRSPSLGGTTSMDIHLKKGLLNNILDMVLLSPKQINFIKDEEHLKAVRRLTNPSLTRHLTARERILSEYHERQENQMMGNFRKIYPVENNIYDDVLRAAFSFENQNKNESLRDSKTEKPVK
ncbi:tubulin polyglutamylase TTLL6-like, partial [Stegodyphus dumicola]|uniref:tubulin polyglutamylase TTLL6-like n=1 Tax=Stegodyphus dumicola TaxID=202533 RepID=UPI0015AB0EC6